MRGGGDKETKGETWEIDRDRGDSEVYLRWSGEDGSCWNPYRLWWDERGYLRWTVCIGPTGCYSDGEQPVRLTAAFGRVL